MDSVTAASPPPARSKLLQAAVHVMRCKGYDATTVDELCAAAGVSKGSFFHHFASKEDLGVAAAHAFSDMADGLFATAPYRSLADPLQRFLGYIDFRISILRGELPQFTCFLGTMVQETYATHPRLREVCDLYISAHAAMVAEDIAAARTLYQPHAEWTAESLAFHTQAVLQGAFILAKAKGGPGIAIETMGHLKRYVEMLFEQALKSLDHAQVQRGS